MGRFSVRTVDNRSRDLIIGELVSSTCSDDLNLGILGGGDGLGDSAGANRFGTLGGGDGLGDDEDGEVINKSKGNPSCLFLKNIFYKNINICLCLLLPRV